MSAVLKQRMNLEAFLEWENREELKYEFDGFEPVGMTGGSAEHAAIQVNVIREPGNRLQGQPCRAGESHFGFA